MNRPFWLSVLLVGVIFPLPPAFLASWFSALVGRHFALSSWAQALLYAVLFIMLLLGWIGIFVFWQRVENLAADKRSGKGQSGKEASVSPTDN